MDNEVVIRVRAEDETDRVFTSIRAKAKKLGEDIERDFKASGTKAGKGLADGIEQALTRGAPSIVKRADKIGDDVVGQMDASGKKAGDKLGQGIIDGFDELAPAVLVNAKTLGDDIEDQMEKSGKGAGEKLGQGIKDGIGKGGSDGGGDGEDLIPGIGKKGAKAGAKAGASFVSALGKSLQGVPDDPRIIGALALVGAVAAPLIGATLGAAVIGGAAGLGIVGGFAAAAQDPRVKGAAIALKDVVGNDLEDAATAFVPAAVGAIGQVRAAWKTILPEVQSIFAQSGKLTGPLIDGILEGVESLVDGIEDAIGDAGPVVDSLADMFAEVGGALADLISGISDESDTFASALDFLTDALVGVIDMIHIFIEVSAAIIDTIRPIGGVIADVINWMDEWVNRMSGSGEESEGLAEKQDTLRGSVDETTSALDAQLSALRAVEEEMRKQTDPLFAVFDLQTKVKKAQEDYNKSLEDNGPHAAKTKKALLDMGKASFELTSALTDAAVQGFNGKLTPAMRNALRNAGNTAEQINALEGELIAAWRAANKWAGTWKATYVTEYKTMGLKSGSAYGGYQGLATGGTVGGAATGGNHDGLRMVGEHGPELVQLPAGSRVTSNEDTPRALASLADRGSSGAYGSASAIQVTFDPSGTDKLVRAIMEMLRAEVRDGGGSVQTVLGVSGVG